MDEAKIRSALVEAMRIAATQLPSDVVDALRAARERMNETEFAGFQARLQEQARQIGAMSYEEAESKRWPCPLLKEGEFSGYDVRPVACRSVFSADKRCCQAMMEAERFEDLSQEHQALAEEIGERAMRIQIEANDKRPIHGAIELRALLVNLLDRI